jgi:nicotinate-nucleotide adenylyltransferase
MIFCGQKQKLTKLSKILFQDNMFTGLFLGSFNPIHVGHLLIANYVVEYTPLEEIWFVISPHNPLKDKNTLIDEHHRLMMVKSSIQNDGRFRACDVEFSLPKPSFTIDTLRKLKSLYPERKFAIVMGSDGLETFEKWKDYKEIINISERFIYPRAIESEGSSLKVENGTFINAPFLEISSTFIRKAIKDGKDIRYFVPENVWLYIHRHGLYL